MMSRAYHPDFASLLWGEGWEGASVESLPENTFLRSPVSGWKGPDLFKTLELQG